MMSVNTHMAISISCIFVATCTVAACQPDGPEPPPNIVLIVADDLGYGELGSYGQERIRTPVLDRLAEQGMRFTRHYSGSPVCAPSRATLLTGLHTGHAAVRDNDEMVERGDVWGDTLIEGNHPLLPETFTIGRMLQEAGYVTAAIGKWGLGGPGDSGEPNLQGFDHWYGYMCQREAHNYYPTHLWRNGERETLPGNPPFSAHQRLPDGVDPHDPDAYASYSGRTFALDVMVDDAVAFVRQHSDEPFFLYLPFPVPHAALQVPEASLAEYEGEFEETPYAGEKGYLPHRAPRAAYAAMISRMDAGIGRILAAIEEAGLEGNTVVMFTSDNGPTFNGGTDSEFFHSTAGLRGLKTTLYEGGTRVPLIVRWPGAVTPGTVSDHVSAFWDYLPTLAEMAGIELGSETETDGLSMVAGAEGRRRWSASARAPVLGVPRRAGRALRALEGGAGQPGRGRGTVRPGGRPGGVRGRRRGAPRGRAGLDRGHGPLADAVRLLPARPGRGDETGPGAEGLRNDRGRDPRGHGRRAGDGGGPGRRRRSRSAVPGERACGSHRPGRTPASHRRPSDPLSGKPVGPKT